MSPLTPSDDASQTLQIRIMEAPRRSSKVTGIPCIMPPPLSLQIRILEAEQQRQQELFEQQGGHVTELQALLQSQEEQLAEVPRYLERMRQAKEVRGRSQQLLEYPRTSMCPWRDLRAKLRH